MFYINNLKEKDLMVPTRPADPRRQWLDEFGEEKKKSLEF